jgi:hypothetical protein
MTTASLTKQAHDPGDPQVASHCPFCGSGAIVGRSDGTIACDMCGMNFLIRVQPAYPGMPQAAEGMGAPTDAGMGGLGPPMGDEMAPGEEPEMGPDGEPLPPGEEGEEEGDGAPPWAEGAEDEEGPPGAEQEAEEEGPPPPPKGKGKKKKGSRERLYATLSGELLPEPAYIRHLAVLHSGGSPRVLAMLRREAAYVECAGCGAGPVQNEAGEDIGPGEAGRCRNCGEQMAVSRLPGANPQRAYPVVHGITQQDIDPGRSAADDKFLGEHGIEAAKTRQRVFAYVLRRKTAALARGTAALGTADRCDRCGAQAMVRTRMPGGTELHWCGHHYREHAPDLAAAGAQVTEDDRTKETALAARRSQGSLVVMAAWQQRQYEGLAHIIGHYPAEDTRTKLAETFTRSLRGSSSAREQGSGGFGVYQPDKFYQAATTPGYQRRTRGRSGGTGGQTTGTDFTQTHYEHMAHVLGGMDLQPAERAAVAAHFSEHLKGFNPRFRESTFFRHVISPGSTEHPEPRPRGPRSQPGSYGYPAPSTRAWAPDHPARTTDYDPGQRDPDVYRHPSPSAYETHPTDPESWDEPFHYEAPSEGHPIDPVFGGKHAAAEGPQRFHGTCEYCDQEGEVTHFPHLGINVDDDCYRVHKDEIDRAEGAFGQQPEVPGPDQFGNDPAYQRPDRERPGWGEEHSASIPRGTLSEGEIVRLRAHGQLPVEPPPFA